MNFVSRWFASKPANEPTVQAPPRVLVIVITSDAVEQRCMDSILAQDHPSFAVMIHASKPVEHVQDQVADRFHNIARNLNLARKMALASDCTHFLFVDSDIILQPDALSSLQSHRKDIVGGWYKMIDAPFWVAGCWVSDHTLFHCEPVASVCKVDMVGHGCMLVTRRALEALPFEAGFDKSCISEVGQCFLGPCASFGNLAASKGFNLYMDGHVSCGHIDRKSGAVIGKENHEECFDAVNC